MPIIPYLTKCRIHTEGMVTLEDRVSLTVCTELEAIADETLPLKITLTYNISRSNPHRIYCVLVTDDEVVRFDDNISIETKLAGFIIHYPEHRRAFAIFLIECISNIVELTITSFLRFANARRAKSPSTSEEHGY